MPPSLLRIALIGAGGQGCNLARCVSSQLWELATLSVVCDVNGAAAKSAREKLGFKHVATDYRAAVTLSEVDAVFVAVPPGLHREVVVAAAEAGKHVFCEKPIAVEPADADAMTAACRKANVVLAVGYLFRYGDNRLALRDFIQRGTIGRPVLWREHLPLYAETQPWLGDEKLGGGAIFEYSHSLDFACYTLGKPVSVGAQLFRFREDPRGSAHDSYAIQVRFESGDVYQLSGYGMLPYPRSSSSALGGAHRVRENDIVGPKGAIYCGPDEKGKTSMVVAEHTGTQHERITRHAWEGWGGFSANPTPAMLREFFEAIRSGKRETRVSGAEARQTLAVLRAAVESSRTGQTVGVAY